MTRTVTKKIDLNSIAILRSLIGGHFQYLGSPSDDGELSVFAIMVTTEFANAVFSARVESEDFEGYPNEFAKIQIDRPDPSFVEATLRGNANRVFHRGQVIRDIFLLEETFQCTSNGSVEWKYVADTGAILSFETGSIMITLASIHSEPLSASMVSNADLESSNKPDYFFEEDLFHTIDNWSKLISLGQEV